MPSIVVSPSIILLLIFECYLGEWHESATVRQDHTLPPSKMRIQVPCVKFASDGFERERSIKGWSSDDETHIQRSGYSPGKRKRANSRSGKLISISLCLMSVQLPSAPARSESSVTLYISLLSDSRQKFCAYHIASHRRSKSQEIVILRIVRVNCAMSLKGSSELRAASRQRDWMSNRF